jgi:hypothetical protein
MTPALGTGFLDQNEHGLLGRRIARGDGLGAEDLIGDGAGERAAGQDGEQD